MAKDRRDALGDAHGSCEGGAASRPVEVMVPFVPRPFVTRGPAQSLNIAYGFGREAESEGACEGGDLRHAARFGVLDRTSAGAF